MEIGSSFALRAAAYVERVYAVDISGRLLQNVLVPCNVRLVLGDGVHIPVPEASIDLAWGGAFMDRLDAGDAAEHLRNVHRALAPGGEYLCRTRFPERLVEAGFSSVCSHVGLTRIPLVLAALIPGQARFAARK